MTLAAHVFACRLWWRLDRLQRRKRAACEALAELLVAFDRAAEAYAADRGESVAEARRGLARVLAERAGEGDHG